MPKKPNVAILRNSYLNLSETFIFDQVTGHRRYTPYVIHKTRPNPDRFHIPRLVPVSDRYRTIDYLRWELFGSSANVDALFRNVPIAIIHAHFANNSFQVLPLARRYGIPVVVSLHGHDVTVLNSREQYVPEFWNYRLHKRRLFAQVALFLAASDEMREMIIRAGCDPGKVVVHRLGVDVGRFRAGKRRGNRLLMVGRFMEKKGHRYGIAAMAELLRRFPGLHLTIVGDGPLKGAYLKQIRDLGIGERVSLPGALGHDAVIGQLAETDIVLAPSVVAADGDRESGMIVAKEAGAAGIPVVGFHHGGLPEILLEGKTGFLLPERDVAGLVEKAALLLGDARRRGRMGEAARRHIRAVYDNREVMARLERTYDKVVAESRTRR